MNDRERWNQKYANGSHGGLTPSSTLVELAAHLPAAGQAIDVAGGAGRHAIWLAQRGLDVTLADVSDVGLNLASERARDSACRLRTLRLDLQQATFPAGPWDLILTVHFLWRPLFASFARSLATGGKLVVIQPTMTNLQRHPKPPAPFLLEDGELPTLIAGLTIDHYAEGWQSDGRHEAVLVARRT